jgi:hypothetical protein
MPRLTTKKLAANRKLTVARKMLTVARKMLIVVRRTLTAAKKKLAAVRRMPTAAKKKLAPARRMQTRARRSVKARMAHDKKQTTASREKFPNRNKSKTIPHKPCVDLCGIILFCLLKKCI